MRLKYLWIENYKNLKNFDLNFSVGKGITLLIGTNGTGKSNIIEAICKAFLSIQDGVVKTNNLGCKFLLCYSNSDGIYFLAGKGKKAVLAEIYYDSHAPEDKKYWASDFEKMHQYGFEHLIEILFTKEYFKYQNISCTVKKVTRLHDNIPNIIAIYSGEETRLWDEIFEAPYKKHLKNIGKSSANFLQMTYLNRFYWDLALFLLYFSGFSTNHGYLKTQIGISNIEKVSFTFNRRNLNNENAPLLTSFLERLFESGEGQIELLSAQIKERICENVSSQQGGIHVSSSGQLPSSNELDNTFYLPTREVMHLLIQACMPKNKKIIERIDLYFNNGMTTHSLSEGEKKLLLIKCALEIGANENTILLMDEPDAFIHESRKRDILALLQEYKEADRQIVITSHSPTLAASFNGMGRIMLEKNSDGNIIQLVDEKLQIIEKLTDGLWSFDERNIFLASQKPLVLTEGIGDIQYLKRAIEVLAKDHPQYANISCDFLQMGGADENANNFITQLIPFIKKERKIVVMFDRDDSGSRGMKSCINRGSDRGEIFKVYRKDNLYYFMLPKTSEHCDLDFVIEDYFTKDKKNSVAKKIIEGADGHFNKFTKDLKQKVKEDLRNKLTEYSSTDLQGFSILLDRLLQIFNDDIPQELLEVVVDE